MKKIFLMGILSVFSSSLFAQSIADADLVSAQNIVLKPYFKEVSYNLGRYIYSPYAMEDHFKSGVTVLLGVCAPQIESLTVLNDKDIYRDEFMSFAYLLKNNKIELAPLKNIYAKSFSQGKQLVTYKDQLGLPNYEDQAMKGFIIDGRELDINLSVRVKGFLEIENNQDNSKITYHRKFIGGKTMRKIQKGLSKKIVYSCHMMNGVKEKFNEVIGF